MSSSPRDFNIPKQYIDQNQRVQHWPRRKKRSIQLNILRFMVCQMELDRIYTEREVNDILKAHHTFSDWAMLRRELFELGWIGRNRDGSGYRRIAETLDDMVDRDISNG